MENLEVRFFKKDLVGFGNRMLGRSANTAYMDRHTDELRRFSDVEGTHWAYL